MTNAELIAWQRREQTPIEKALRRAYQLGQTYWQQADSESYKQNRLSDDTRQKFEALLAETLAQSPSPIEPVQQDTQTNHSTDAPSELHEAARLFHNLTQGDPEVIIRPPSAEKRDAIIAAGTRLRAALAPSPIEPVPGYCPHCGGTKGHWDGCRAPAEPVLQDTKAWQPDWQHAANERADMSSNALQGLRNIIDGISTPEAVLADLMRNLAHCEEVEAQVRAAPTKAPSEVAVAHLIADLRAHAARASSPQSKAMIAAADALAARSREGAGGDDALTVAYMMGGADERAAARSKPSEEAGAYPPLPTPFHKEASTFGWPDLYRAEQVREAIDADRAARPREVAVPTQAALDVLAERRRQIDKEGWTPEHDDAHVDFAMVKAASCYAWSACGHTAVPAPVLWPWDSKWWKPKTPRQDLVRATALLLAQIERLDRAARSNLQVGGDVPTDKQIEAAWGRYDEGIGTRRELAERILALAAAPSSTGRAEP